MTSPGSWRAHRVLYPGRVKSLEDYLTGGGGSGLAAAARLAPTEIINLVTASGLRGRGGAGFPVGRKWTTVAQSGEHAGPPTVVVNGAEGEPGTFKDRSIIRANPYHVVEGALIAAKAVGSAKIVIASKESFAREVLLLRTAVEEMRGAGMIEAATSVEIFEGPDEYLYGEESALLETIDGRQPFPRVAPTYRVGQIGADRNTANASPALVNNVESIANVAKIVARGADWFRRIGTAESPGTIVSTVTGDTRRSGVAEVRMGTPLRQILKSIGGGPLPGRPLKAVLAGVANPVILGTQLEVPVSYEGMSGIGCGLGSAGFMAFDDTTDMVALAAGVARFLSVESCGQCSPCKLDGMKLTELLTTLAANNATPHDMVEIERRIQTVAYGARCYLAIQQETVLNSIIEHFRSEFDAHLAGTAEPTQPVFIAELINIEGGRATYDERHRSKQPDWSFNATYSGYVPVEIRSPSSVPLEDNLLPRSGW